MDEASQEVLARRLVETYSDQLLRLSWSLLGSLPDAQDVCQEVLLKRLSYTGQFQDSGHERAWMIRVTVNACKNLRRSLWRRRTVPLEEENGQLVFQPEPGGALEELQTLPFRDRQVLILYYYIGYSTQEIAQLLGIQANAVRARLVRARAKLKHRLEVQDS